MPIAKSAEPANRPTPIGPADGAGWEPNRPVPVPMRSANRVAVVPRSSACARSPVPLPTATSCRQAEVKPKREWKRAVPRPRPSRSSTPGLAPCADHTYAVRAAASSPDTASGVRRTGGRGGASGRAEEVGEGANRVTGGRGGAAGAGPAGGAVVTEDLRGGARGRGRGRGRDRRRGSRGRYVTQRRQSPSSTHHAEFAKSARHSSGADAYMPANIRTRMLRMPGRLAMRMLRRDGTDA